MTQPQDNPTPTDTQAVRGPNGTKYWRSLEELAMTPGVQQRLQDEFSGYDPEGIVSMSRRNFVGLMGASLALAGVTLSGCRRWPREEVVAFASRPEGWVPGTGEYYATSMELGGVAQPLLARSYDGRPIKLEGNPDHPVSRGASTAFAQASVLSLYDPDRSRTPRAADASGQMNAATWEQFAAFANTHFGDMASRGKRLAVLSEATSSPTAQRLREQLSERYPGMLWLEYEPISTDNARRGCDMVFGQKLQPTLDLTEAKVIVSLDADILGPTDPNHLVNARNWAAGRKSADTDGTMSRMYVAEGMFSTTGSVADERLPVRASKVGQIAEAIAARLELQGFAGGGGELNGSSEFVQNVVADLRANAGRCVVVAGANQPPEVHALCMLINAHLKNIGRAIRFMEVPGTDRPTHAEAIKDVAGEALKDEIDTLIILGGNPVYDAPKDARFDEMIESVPTRIHLSEYINETSMACTWHLPKAHYLESWGDARAYDGSITLTQPLILPLFGGKSSIELLGMLAGRGSGSADGQADGQALVRETVTAVIGSDDPVAWRSTLHQGFVVDTAYPVVTPSVVNRSVTLPEPAAAGSDLELLFLPSASVYDGRFANSGWLQETPDPMTKCTWDNPLLISVVDSQKTGITTGDMVKVETRGGTLECAAYVMPGLAAGVLAIELGYGRTVGGNVAVGTGFDSYTLRSSADFAGAAAVKSLAKTGASYDLALTQMHHLLGEPEMEVAQHRVGDKGESGYLLKEATLDDYKKNPKFASKGHGRDLSLQLFEPPLLDKWQAQAAELKKQNPEAVANGWEPPELFNEPHAWGMTIDMNACIGCTACVVACQAENNIPVVGKNEVLVSREMQWLRVDRYFKTGHGEYGDQNPEVVHMPMMCVHCENAPCEQVCPVAATVHDTEGLNTMVYNRCIGTRYCSNNCPYKVRRFNYFDYHAKDPRGTAQPWLDFPDTQQNAAISEIKQMLFNPEVTVRMRGVMEKCTYCTQRIAEAKIEAKADWARGDRDTPLVEEGEVVTACQQACPTTAIKFGNLNDPYSKVSKEQKVPRSYKLLDVLNTRPRTLHMAKIRNPKGGEA